MKLTLSMNLKQYIQCCIDQKDFQELAVSWHYSGALKVTSETRFYKSGNLYVIQDPNSVFNNQLLYCDVDYNDKINWSTVSTIDEAQQTTIKDGLTAPCFSFFDTTIDLLDVPTRVGIAEADPNFKPFVKYVDLASSNTDIIIDDDQYYQIMQVIGQPWVKDRELEYKRQAILKLAVEPALRMYYTYFPLIQEQVLPHRMGDFLIPYITKPYPAYKAIVWVTSPGGVSKGAMSANGLNPLTALGSDIALYNRSANGGSAGFNIKYNKPVPGWTGQHVTGISAFNELSTAWPTANTLKNLMRREKVSKIHIPGQGLFAKGYSNLSGYLNIRWFCWSRDFNDVEFEDWNKVVQLCQAHVKFSIGAVRDLLNPDSNIKFRDGLQKEGATEIAAIEKDWVDNPYRMIFTPARGGNSV